MGEMVNCDKCGKKYVPVEGHVSGICFKCIMKETDKELDIKRTKKKMKKKGVTMKKPKDDIKQIYANGFKLQVGSSDIMIDLLLNNKEICSLNLSYSSGKTLAEKLNCTISLFECTTDISIPTIDRVNKLLFKTKGVKNENNRRKNKSYAAL